jgi:ubiquitin C-terminal hydrolase
MTNISPDHSFLSSINLNNPLSISKGQMAIAFARLASRLLTETRPIFPLEIKRLVAKHWALYDPYQQHDTQEFLNFLLDCIHEDLNMASRTPYTFEDENLPDEELAQAYWKTHTLRNDSLVVDSFFGMYKSQIVCTGCSKSSTKFDPFMSLTLEIPEQPIHCGFPFVRADLSKFNASIPITTKDTVKDILIKVASQVEAEGPVSVVRKLCGSHLTP